MPELPEVETTRRGILPAVQGQRVTCLTVRDARLRWPVPPALAALEGQLIRDVSRRGKYLLLHTDAGTALVHLGMSGSLRLARAEAAWRTHDHIELALTSGWRLRFHDPRRFGCFLWLPAGEDPYRHALLAGLGPEPLTTAFDGNYLFARSRGRRVPVKSFLMDSHVVVGVGNIYANEALFRAGIHPLRAAGRIGAGRYARLADEVKGVLAYAIERGGTTLRDFVSGQGEAGYFQLELDAYGRAGQPCRRCQALMRELRLGGRTTVYCPQCQH